MEHIIILQTHVISSRDIIIYEDVYIFIAISSLWGVAVAEGFGWKGAISKVCKGDYVNFTATRAILNGNSQSKMMLQ